MSFSTLTWILLSAYVAFIFLYQVVTKDDKALTSKFVSKKSIPTDNVDRNLIIRALKKANFKRAHFDPDEHIFRAKNPISVFSFGEFIEVDLQNKNGSAELTFTSVSAFPLQIIAWGQNRENAERFNKSLEQILPREEAAMS